MITKIWIATRICQKQSPSWKESKYERTTTPLSTLNAMWMQIATTGSDYIFRAILPDTLMETERTHDVGWSEQCWLYRKAILLSTHLTFHWKVGCNIRREKSSLGLKSVLESNPLHAKCNPYMWTTQIHCKSGTSEHDKTAKRKQITKKGAYYHPDTVQHSSLW